MIDELWKCGRCRVEYGSEICTYQVVDADGRTRIIVCGPCFGSRSEARSNANRGA